MELSIFSNKRIPSVRNTGMIMRISSSINFRFRNSCTVLASDPDILALSKVDDSMLQLLSPIARAAVLVSRKLVEENPPNR